METFSDFLKMRQQSGRSDCIEDYEVLDLLGQGGFASVYRARCLRTNFMVAIKMINKIQMNAARMENRVKQEISIHARLKHPSILQLYTFFEDINYVYLVLELAQHGELQQYLKKTNIRLTEIETANIINQVVKGLLYLHTQDIIHRDMSLSNLLLTNEFQIKIADFGLATLSGPNERHTTLCGTPNYISPEVASRSTHGRPADVWGLGCMLYTLLVGKPPFDSENGGIKSTLNKVLTSNFTLPSYLSAEAKDLLNRLLQKNPSERITLNQVLLHPFMTCINFPSSNDGKNGTQNNDCDSGILCTMSSSDASRQMSQRFNRSRSEDRYPPISFQPSCRQQESAYSSFHNPHCYENTQQSKQKSIDNNCFGSIRDGTENSMAYVQHSNFSDNVLNVINNYQRPIDPGGGGGRFGKNQSLDVKNHNGGFLQHLPLQNAHHENQENLHQIQCTPIFKNQQQQIKQISVPSFSTKRLLPTRHKTKNAILTIESNGGVVIEFIKFKPKYNEDRIVDVCRISGDGQNIIIYSLNASGGAQIQDYPQPLPSTMSLCTVYTYQNLPSQHWKKYMYAARFIELVRNKTPKITLFTNMAKCQLMESLTEFEAYFYTGEKITKLSDNSIKAYNEHGLMVSDNSEQLFSLWPIIWQHFNQCLEKCQMIEKKMNEMENIGDGDWFPIVVGRKPIPLAERGLTTTEINRNVVPMTPRTPRIPSFSISATSNTSSSRPPNSVEIGQKMISVPGIGTATRTIDNVLHIHYNDGTKLSILPKDQGGFIKYLQSSTSISLQYTMNDVLPEIVRKRLEQIPDIVKKFTQQEDNVSTLRFLR